MSRSTGQFFVGNRAVAKPVRYRAVRTGRGMDLEAFVGVEFGKGVFVDHLEHSQPISFRGDGINIPSLFLWSVIEGVWRYSEIDPQLGKS
jgi:hypothetical protein